MGCFCDFFGENKCLWIVIIALILLSCNGCGVVGTSNGGCGCGSCGGCGCGCN